MDTWNIDRIYNWLALAMAHETPANQKFYFDFTDKTFFDLIENEKKYSIPNAERLSAEDIDLLHLKIEKINTIDSSILSIKKPKRILKHLFDQTTSYENYMKREEEWNFVNEEINKFFNTHSINIQEARIIE